MDKPLDRIEVFYFRSWEFIGTPEQLPTGLFRAVVHYKSLKTQRLGMLEVDTRPCATFPEALALGWKDAMAWA